MNALPFDLQLLNGLAALFLLLSFAMLAQRRVVTLVNLLAWQGFLLFARRCCSPGARTRATCISPRR